MAVQVPTPEQVKAAATEVGLSLTDEDIQSYIALMKPNVHAYNLVDAMPDDLPVVRAREARIACDRPLMFFGDGDELVRGRAFTLRVRPAALGVIC